MKLNIQLFGGRGQISPVKRGIVSTDKDFRNSIRKHRESGEKVDLDSRDSRFNVTLSKSLVDLYNRKNKISAQKLNDELSILTLLYGENIKNHPTYKALKK